MNFYQQAGKLALGSRLRQLSEKISEDAARLYTLYDVPLDPRWFPVFYMLTREQPQSIQEIAQRIGHSHASVSQIVKAMAKQGLVTTTKAPADRRVTLVQLSAQAKQSIPHFDQQCRDVAESVEALLLNTQHNLWQAIEEVEFLLTEQDLYSRVQSVRKGRESQAVQIINYAPGYQPDFKRLNEAWITQYFELEAADREALDHPNEKILQPGGAILLAQLKGEIVGTCALLKIDDQTYELAKMTVAEAARGKHVGWRLGQAAIQKARELGATRLYLESNTQLVPAIQLYQKLGFQRVVGHASPYARCNIQMMLSLD